MGCIESTEETRRTVSPSSGETGRKRIKSKLDIWLDMNMKAEGKAVTLLLFGAGDSGKTTIRKQLSNVHEKCFRTPASRTAFAPIITANIVDGTLQVLNRMDDPKYRDIFERLQQDAQETQLSKRMADLVVQLYHHDVAFQETMRNKPDEVQLHDCYHDFCVKLKDFPTWGGKGWIPSEEDCIRSRARTSGVTRSQITIGNQKYIFTDVGGQRAERRKWMKISHEASIAIFVAALSEYNQALFEERRKNRLEESLDLFGQCTSEDWMRNVPVVLFLNKKDLFDQKFLVDKIPLNVSGRFPDAPSGNEDAKAAVAWIASRFAKKRKGNSSSLPVHVLTATDPQTVRDVFQSCTKLLLRKSLEERAQPSSTMSSAAESSGRDLED